MAHDNNGTDPLAGRFGRSHQLALALGGILGSGWLMSIPSLRAEAGVFALLSWPLAMAVIGMIILVIVQLAKAVPAESGLVSWPSDSSGPVVGTVMAAGLFVVYAGNPPAGVTTAIIAVDRANVLPRFWTPSPDCGNTGPQLTHCTASGADRLPQLNEAGLYVAVAVLVVLFAINVIGFAMMVRLNTVLTVAKVALPVLFAVIVIVSYNAGDLSTQHSPGVFASHTPSDYAPWDPSWSKLGAAFQAVLGGGLIFALTGFQGPVDHGTKRGARHVGFAMFGALLIAGALYLALQVLSMSHGWDGWPVSMPDNGWVSALLLAAIMLAPLTNALLFVWLAGTVLHASALKGIGIPGTNLKKDPWGRPLNSFVVTFLFGVLMLLAPHGLSQITTAKSVLFLLVYSFAAIYYTAYRRTVDPDKRDRFTRSLRIVGPTSLAVATTLIFYAGLPALLTAYLVLAVVGALMFTYKIRRSKSTDWRTALHKSRWLFNYFGALLALTAIQFAALMAWPGSALQLDQEWGIAKLLLGWTETETSFRSETSLHVLAVGAFAAGLWVYRAGVRHSVDVLQERKSKNRV